MIEIPPKFAGLPPVNPEARKKRELIEREWKGAQGLAEDVRYYGSLIREEAEKRIGHLYPKVLITSDMALGRPDLKAHIGKRITAIAWIWARTVKSPNPAFSHIDVPLVSTFILTSRAGKDAYIEPVIEKSGYRFTVKVGKLNSADSLRNGTKVSRANFQCIMSGEPIPGDYIKSEAKAGRMGVRLLAVVADGEDGRVYLPPTPEQELAAKNAKPNWMPDVEISGSTQYIGVKPYGMAQFSQLFTSRQLLALATFSDLVQDVREQVFADIETTKSLVCDNAGLASGGSAGRAYADSIAVYLAFSVDKCTDYWNTSTTWMPRGTVGHLFARQAIQMTWDFPEANPLSDFHCAWQESFEWVAKAIETLPAIGVGLSQQQDAAQQTLSTDCVVSTDPPYYDNVPYADISDFFYVWVRRSLKSVLPELCSTLAVPKSHELVAFAYRHPDGKLGAEKFFLDGMTNAMHRLCEQSHPAFPVTIYYAFKQAESDASEGTSSTGWETFLDSVIRASFTICGTWPMRTEREARSRGIGSNALASSIILVCRRRMADAPTATRREFVIALKAELPVALRHLQEGNIAPVDLAQAAIGPGMGVYTRYTKVLDADGKPVPVREALTLINQVLDETLAEQEGDFDADSRFAIAWFEQQGFEEGEFGVADVLARAKVTSVSGLAEAGILESKRGKVRLLKSSELPSDWDPSKDQRLTHWEIVHQLIRALETGGEGSAATLVAKLGSKTETARELAYRLYSLCERKKRSAEALSYNALVQSWPEIIRLAKEGGRPKEKIGELFGDEEN